MRCPTNRQYWNGSKIGSLESLHKQCLCSMRKVGQVASIIELAKKAALIRTSYFNIKELFEWP